MDAQECVRLIGAVVPGCWELPDVVLNLDLLQEIQESCFSSPSFCSKTEIN